MRSESILIENSLVVIEAVLFMSHLLFLFFYGDSHIAETVIINGKIVIEKGKIVTINQEKLIYESTK